MNLFVDGGGTATVPTYFSYKCVEGRLSMDRFLLKNLAPDLLPAGCSVYDNRGLSTNNLAEWAALYYGLRAFRQRFEYSPVLVYQDSQLVVRQVTGEYRCKKEHLQSWLRAVKMLWTPNTQIEWVPRKQIVEVLGH